MNVNKAGLHREACSSRLLGLIVAIIIAAASIAVLGSATLEHVYGADWDPLYKKGMEIKVVDQWGQGVEGVTFTASQGGNTVTVGPSDANGIARSAPDAFQVYEFKPDKNSTTTLYTLENTPVTIEVTDWPSEYEKPYFSVDWRYPNDWANTATLSRLGLSYGYSGNMSQIVLGKNYSVTFPGSQVHAQVYSSGVGPMPEYNLNDTFQDVSMLFPAAPGANDQYFNGLAFEYLAASGSSGERLAHVGLKFETKTYTYMDLILKKWDRVHKCVLSNVEFGVYNNSGRDITLQDGTTVASDALIAKIKTDENGETKLEGLPDDGKYLIKEEYNPNEGFDPYPNKQQDIDPQNDYYYFTPGPSPGINGEYKRTIENDPKQIGIRIWKNVKGQGADQKKVFKFTITLDRKISGYFGGIGFEDGVATFTLRGNRDNTATYLPIGVHYVIEEDDYSNEGYVVDKKSYSGVLDEDDEELVFTFTNTYAPKFDVEISKIEIGGSEELPGAKLTLTSEDAVGFDTLEWVSGEEPEKVKIPAGAYTLTETTAPDGYAKAESIDFRVTADGKVEIKGESGDYTESAEAKVTMEDDWTKVKISKTDITGEKELGGAKLQVIDKDENIVEEWTSVEGESHLIEKTLVAGETYTLREITAPKGYEIAEDIMFRLTEDGTVQIKGEDGEWADADNNIVIMKDAEEEPDKPTTPGNPSNSDNPDKPTTTTTTDKSTTSTQTGTPTAPDVPEGVQTGDDTDLMLLACLIVAAGALLAVTAGLKRKSRKA